MFVPAGADAQVSLVVVAYGAPGRLRDCIGSLVAHESSRPFDIICVANPDTRSGHPDVSWLPDGVRAIAPEANLGWAGGLHAARAEVGGPLMAWVQDDVRIVDGWLDALADAADSHPKVAAFGAIPMDGDDRVDGVSAGWAVPPDDVDRWNDTDVARRALPSEIAVVDWITSKGSLHRVEAWDDVGGPSPLQYPLNHVDKEYCTHLRAHGWGIALVPDARLRHGGSQSSPSLFREFLNEWQRDEFNATWGAVASALAGGGRGPVAHPCHGPWTMSDVERACGREASRMLVPLSRFAVAAQAAATGQTSEEYRRSGSWRITRPLRAIVDLGRRLASPAGARRREATR